MGKKSKNKNQSKIDWEDNLEAPDDAYEDIPDPTLTSNKKDKKKNAKGNQKTNEKLPDNDGRKPKNTKTKPSISELDMDDNLSVNFGDHSPEQVIEPKEHNKRNKIEKSENSYEDDDIASSFNELELEEKKDEHDKGGKKSKKKKKRGLEFDELYGENDNDTETKNIEDELNLDSNDTEVKPGKKNEESTQKTENEEHGEEGEFTGMKTAAQKRAEKKERDKKKKEAEKKKAAKKKKKQEDVVEKADTESTEKAEIKEDDAPVTVDSMEKETKEEPPAPNETNEVEEKEEGETEASDSKKKKRKKKRDEDKEKSKKTKGPGKAALAKMQEALEEAQREKERLLAEAEAKQKAEEAAEEARLEKIRLEKEKKERKKIKDKERKERLKKEGKYLTAAQKEQKRRAEAMLEMMKQQGIHVPTKDITTEKPKKPMYGKKKKQQKQSVSSDQTDTKIEELPKEDKVEEPPHEKENVIDGIEDSWDAEDRDETEDKIIDSWDADEDVEGSTAPVTEPKQPVKELKKQVSSKSEQSIEDSDEEDEETEDESSEGESTEGESSEESEEESESDEEDKKMTPQKIKERARERIEIRKVENENKRSTDVLRAPVICVLGHVDTGKTKILDKIRRTNVQDGEAGGITQQIGATNVPVDKIREQTKMVKEFQKLDLKLPGLLIIDTPGHESFSNLRSRGSNLCDMAILVVDIMHGLEPQTIESINLLKKKQTPFVVALNKIDRLFEWKKSPNVQVEDTVTKQGKITKQEFDERSNMVINQFAEQGLNAALHYANPNEKEYISLVPTSAHSGDGMGDLMALICKLTQTRLAKKLAYSEELESTVMEVKALPGLGTTIDVILVNGKLKEGDTIVTGGIEGAIVTQIRSVLTPQPMRELRVKAQYIHHQCLKAAQGAKLCGKDLEKVLAGSPVYVAQHPDEVEVLKEDVEEFVSSSLKAIKVSERGVYVQASTLGSLEALLEFLKTSKIPYCGVNIGPVHKRDIMRCSVMLEHEPMYAVVLAFDVKIERDAQEHADKEGIKIFSAEIIYHLFDKFTAYCEEYKEKQREKYKHLAIYPCKMKILPEHIFNTRDPIVVGVNVEAGTLRIGTPIIVPSKERLMIGFVTGIEANHKQLEKSMSGQEVCVKIEPQPGEAPKLYGRHFTYEDMLCSRITRESIDIMKQYFREDMTKSDWQLIIELKKLLDIV